MATRYIKLFETEANRQTYEHSANYQEPYSSGVVDTRNAYYNASIYDNNNNQYLPKNYIQAAGYSSFANTPITAASTDLIEIGVTIVTRKNTGWCWILGYSASESNRFGIYIRNSSSYAWTFDFWRGSGYSNRISTSYTPTAGQRYEFTLGNPSLSANNVVMCYENITQTYFVPETSGINPITSTQYYIVNENRSAKSGNVFRYHYLKIYKQQQQNIPKKLVLDWIPVQRVSDNAYGFYDNITKNFYVSNGTVAFSGG